MKLLVVAIILCCASTLDSLRILSVVPTPTKSHYSPSRRIIFELVRRGHEVVSISPFEEKNQQNFTWIPIEVNSFKDAVPDVDEKMKVPLPFVQSQLRLWNMLNDYTKYIVRLPKLKDFIENDISHFDIVFIEEFFSPIFFLFAHKYRAPMILISSFGSAHYISEYMGNALELSYAPHEFLPLFSNFNFLTRAQNLFSTIFDLIGRKIYILNTQENLVKDVFNKVSDAPSLSELERNASLIFVNSHPSMTVVRPFLPNIIEVGGVHLEDVKPLNQELQAILDGATDGAILFSFGTVMELARQPEDLVIKILNTLGKLKQRVLIKWNSPKKIPVTHKNLYPYPWLPQFDILGHPNLILFVTHGGLLSAQESIYHGVPTICVPFFGDQPLNCKRSVQMGYGLHLNIKNLGSDDLERSIIKILSDDSFRNKARELSQRFRDRPTSALDTAIYWIEYCARHKGMDFMKGPKRNLYWFQYYFVDLIFLMLMIFWCGLKLLMYLKLRLFAKTSMKSKTQ